MASAKEEISKSTQFPQLLDASSLPVNFARTSTPNKNSSFSDPPPLPPPRPATLLKRNELYGTKGTRKALPKLPENDRTNPDEFEEKSSKLNSKELFTRTPLNCSKVSKDDDSDDKPDQKLNKHDAKRDANEKDAKVTDAKKTDANKRDAKRGKIISAKNENSCKSEDEGERLNPTLRFGVDKVGVSNVWRQTNVF